jgi:UDP-N-acetyl-D-mannosaminuronic acid dehydrogenase
MDVVVLGLGYIGLPTAAMLAEADHYVFGVDVDSARLDDIRSGCRHVADIDVRELAVSALESGRFCIGSALPESADAYVLCVPTPTRERRPDLRYVEEAVRSIAPKLQEGNLVVLESTVPPGTVENVLVRTLIAAGKDPDRLHIAHCPERVIPGAILFELRNNARVIGGRRAVDAEKARELYASFCTGTIGITDCRTAELVKVVENTYRDINLAFANELALLAESLGVDAWEVIRLANEHPRVNVLRPGPGVGGHCIPVDPKFLSNANPFLTELIQTARRINERMPHVVARMVDDAVASVSSPKVALLGAAYKADVDDARESPARAIAELLHDRHYAVNLYDPLVTRFDYELSPTLEDCVRGADALVLVTDHRAFLDIDPEQIAPLMRHRTIVDTRGVLPPQRWIDAGFEVRTLGRASRSDAVAEAAPFRVTA